MLTLTLILATYILVSLYTTGIIIGGKAGSGAAALLSGLAWPFLLPIILGEQFGERHRKAMR